MSVFNLIINDNIHEITEKERDWLLKHECIRPRDDYYVLEVNFLFDIEEVTYLMTLGNHDE